MPLSYLFTISLFITPILSPNCSQPPHPLTGDVVGRRLGVEEVEFGRRLWLSICPLRFPQWCGFVGGHCFFFFSSPIYGFQGPWVGLCRSGGDCLDLMGSTIINRRFCSWKSKFLSRSTRNEICLLQVYFHIFIYIYFFMFCVIWIRDVYTYMLYTNIYIYK